MTTPKTPASLSSRRRSHHLGAHCSTISAPILQYHEDDFHLESSSDLLFGQAGSEEKKAFLLLFDFTTPSRLAF
jgi:hypothetical protein